ncbi:MAG: murein biosynthesis integral membrane protein MurJ [Chloroflexi bacterium]|nr:murein biosynthesis integral membrane protein MurJ [Chloroflexota bacterium]
MNLGRGSGTLGGAALVVGLGFVGSRLLGVVRNMVISGLFGTGPELDAYFAAFRLPDIVFQLLAGAALASAFIPTLSSYFSTRGPEEGWRLASAILNLTFLATLVICGLAYLLAPWLVPLTVPGFSPAQKELTVALTRVMLLSPLLFSVSGIVSGILHVRYHFLLPAVAPMVYNLSIIAGGWLLARPLGVGSLAVGVVVGSALYLLVQVPALLKMGMVYRPLLSTSHPGVREVGRLMLPRVLGLAAVQVNFLITTIFASGLASGSLAALSYAWALMMMPLGVFGMSISTAVFPRLAEQAAVEGREVVGSTVAASLRLIIFFSLPASIGLLLLREPVVALLFQRGLFGAQSTQATAWALLFYSLGLFGHSMLEILTRGFYALKDTATPLALAAVSMVVNLALALTLMPLLSHGGLALSLSLATIMEAFLSLYLLQRRLVGLVDRRLMTSVARSGVASGAMALVLLALLQGRPGGWPVPGDALLLVAIGVSVGSIIYLVTTYIAGSEELRVVQAKVMARWLQVSN